MRSRLQSKTDQLFTMDLLGNMAIFEFQVSNSYYSKWPGQHIKEKVHCFDINTVVAKCSIFVFQFSKQVKRICITLNKYISKKEDFRLINM